MEVKRESSRPAGVAPFLFPPEPAATGAGSVVQTRVSKIRICIIFTPTAAQTAANRANAFQSTGPRSAEGKARSSKNAVTHGFNCAGFIVAEDQRQEFDELRASLSGQIEPISAVERETFTQLLHAAWNLRRVRRLQAALFDSDLDPLANPEMEDQMDRYARYEVRFERSYYRAIKELRRLKTDAALRGTLPESVAAVLPDLASPREILRAKRTQNEAFADSLEDILSYGMGPNPAFEPPAGWPERKNPTEFPNSFTKK